MTLAELKTILEGITGYSNKVVYWAWKEKSAPALPFICYFETGANNFFGDDIVYYSFHQIQIELYTEDKAPEEEAKVETALTNAGITWSKNCDFLDDEKCWMITYTVEV